MSYLYPNGSKYEGEIENDLFNGKGIFYFSNGDIYEGNFINDEMCGEGIYKYKSGDIYYGQFERDKFNGLGTYKHKDGSIFKGRFKDDLRIGKFLNYENDKLYETIFQNDKIVNDYKEINLEDITAGKYERLNIKSLDDFNIPGN